GPRGQFRHVVDRRVGLDAAELPEIVDGMAAVGCAPSDPEQEEPASPGSEGKQPVHQSLDDIAVQLVQDLSGLPQILSRVRNWQSSRLAPSTLDHWGPGRVAGASPEDGTNIKYIVLRSTSCSDFTPLNRLVVPLLMSSRLGSAPRQRRGVVA